MSRKHSELEREFLDELALRTGRSLGEWMSAIDDAGIAGRNGIIDWLRPQGLTFAHASWLERIHHNGGRPIYIGVPGGPSIPVPVKAPPAAAPAPPPPARPPQRAPDPIPPASPAQSEADAAGVASLVARGKGLRPLAEHLLREIQRARPTSRQTAAGDLISIADPAEIAVLAVGPRELRLGLAMADASARATAGAAAITAARIPGAGSGITHMVVLNDARQVDQALIGLVLLANTASRTP